MASKKPLLRKSGALKHGGGGVTVLCWGHCCGFIENWRDTVATTAVTCHPLRFAFSRTIHFSIGEWPQTHLRAASGLPEQGGEWCRWNALQSPDPQSKGQSQVLSAAGNCFLTVGNPFQQRTSWSFALLQTLFCLFFNSIMSIHSFDAFRRKPLTEKVCQ